jgi:SAM-dependent methyltransferase
MEILTLRTIQETSLSIKITYKIRNLLSRPLFKVLEGNLGLVLDIGGGSFYKTLNKSSWENYFVLEPDFNSLPQNDTVHNVFAISGDASSLPVKEKSVDTVILIQVLQFIYEPVQAIREINRILTTNGRLIIQVPQSGNLHGIPAHYYNFTRFWLERVLIENNYKVTDYVPLGGAWRTIASRLFLMFWPVFKHPYYFDKKFKKRGAIFWILSPLSLLISIIFFPISMLLSLGDIKEEANNHLIVARKVEFN